MSATAGTAPRPARSYRRLLAVLVLVGDALVVGFASLVAKDLGRVGRGQALLAGAVLALLCVVAAGRLRSRVGFALGWLVQVLLVLSGIAVPLMFALGALSALLWAAALVQGARADALTAQRLRDAG